MDTTSTDYADTPEQGREAVDALRSTKCAGGCRGLKRTGRSFCWTCWGKLPGWLQTQLYRVEGYGRTFAAAVAFLNTPFAAKMPHPPGIEVGAEGMGWEQSDAEGMRRERVRVRILEVHGPVLRVEFRTSWSHKWHKKVMMARDFKPGDGKLPLA